MTEPETQGTRFERLRALAVHAFTASGALWGFLALLAASREDWRAMFLWLAVALFVDGIDGAFARRYDVLRHAPRFSGASLDLVIDFFTYVIVPVYALLKFPYLEGGWALAAAAAILLSSAFYFADEQMKTEDAWFQGFPAVWNLYVFYIFLLDPPGWTVFVSAIFLSGFTFAKYVFVHPVRVKLLRPVTLGLLGLWSILAGSAVWWKMEPPAWVVWALCLIGVYFVALGWFRVKPEGAAR